ncbi:MAG: hypothetical protein FJ146_15745 [Deltaproteobacteria bacterium]|nr:hypothetical protein [Deltaproteobacteria bacterium]
MNSDSNKQNESVKTKKRSHWAVSCDADVHKKIKRLVQKANKKETGQRITASSIISLALSLVTEDHILTLQEQSLTTDEKLEQLRLKYAKSNGPITREGFLSILLAAHQRAAAENTDKPSIT